MAASFAVPLLLLKGLPAYRWIPATAVSRVLKAHAAQQILLNVFACERVF